jgi:hypothetical protein
MKANLLIIIAVCAIITGCHRAPEEPLKHFMIRLEFPETQLRKGERIIGFKIAFTCLHIEQVRHIPYDWQIDISGPSWQPIASGSFGHGTAALNSIKELSGMFILEAQPPMPGSKSDCREVHAIITTMDFEEHTRELIFTNEQLKFRNDNGT